MANAGMMQTYDYGFAAGSVNREDLEDIIINIAPTEVPLFSTLGRTPITHTTHEWLEDTLASPSASPYSGDYAAEGADFCAQAASVPLRVTNWTQIFRKDIKVSETQRVVNPAGMRDVYQYEIDKAMKEIARHMERKLFDQNVSLGVTGASGTLRQWKPLGYYIGTASTLVACASTAPLQHNKSAIDQLIEKCIIAGGNPTKIYCHPNSKTQFANQLSGVNTRNIAASDGRVVGNIDAYQTNFNVVEVIPDRFIPSGSTAAAFSNATADGRWWLLDQTYIKLGVLRPLKHVPIPPAGDAVRGMVLTEATLVVKAPLAHSFEWNVITAVS